jgi:hypothetical protein
MHYEEISFADVMLAEKVASLDDSVRNLCRSRRANPHGYNS